MAKIAIVAYHKILVRTLKPRLERLNHEVIEIEQGELAEQAINGGYDLIIVDKALLSLYPELGISILGKIHSVIVDERELYLPTRQLRPGEMNLGGFLQLLPHLLDPQPEEDQ